MKVDIRKKEHASITLDWQDMVSIYITKSNQPCLFVIPDFERNGWKVGFVGEGEAVNEEDFKLMRPEED